MTRDFKWIGFKVQNNTANEKINFKSLSETTKGNIYGRQRVFLMKFILVTASGESEPVPRLLAHGCQTWSIRAACQHLPQLFDLGNLSNPNSNATSPTFMPFITSVEQAPQLCSHKHSQPQEGWRKKCKIALLSIALLIKIFMDF